MQSHNDRTPVKSPAPSQRRAPGKPLAPRTPASRHGRGRRLPPEILTDMEVRRLMAACGGEKPVPVRNRALIVLAEQGRTADAITSMERAIALDAHNHVARYNLAVSYFQESQFENAATHARVASELDASNPMAHGLLASALIRLERPAEAAESFQRAVALLADGHPRKDAFGRALAECEKSPRTDQASKRGFWRVIVGGLLGQRRQVFPAAADPHGEGDDNAIDTDVRA